MRTMLRIIVHYEEAEWCQEILAALRKIIINFIILFGAPRVGLFLHQCETQHNNLEETVDAAIEHASQTRPP